MQELIGTGVALVTPFKQDFSVDTDALTKIVNYVIEGGVDYLVVLGTTAESATLNTNEKQLVIDIIKNANNQRVPMVLGVGGNNTLAVVDSLKTTNFDGFSAILSVSPYYNKPTQKGIYEHFSAIAKASPLPILLYNVPGRTSSNMLPETVIKLANDFPNIIGVKEAAGDIVQAMKLIQHKPKDFLVISGDDMITLSMVLAGGSGVISVIGQGLPKEFSSMVKLGLNNQVEEANQLHYRMTDIIDMIFEQGNPAGIKEIFKHLDLSSNVLRLPLVSVDSSLSQRIKFFLENFSN